MKWFEGSINEAVATSKSRKAIFVVFVEGKDDTSTQVAEAINTTEVSHRLEQEDFVAIRLESGSESYVFFAQIYQLVPVPSLFFIGENGIPLEIVAGSTTSADLLAKIDLVLSKAGKNKNTSTNLIDAEQRATATNNAANKTSINVDHGGTNAQKSNVETTVEQTAPESASNVAITNETKGEPSTSIKATEAPKTTNDKKEPQTKELTTEEKLENARKMIEIQQKQRVEEEERKEKERELERRKMRREMQNIKRTEKQQELSDREKIRQQIAQDKLERKQKELALQQQMQQQQPSQEPPKPYTPVANDSTVTRIQFRLPSGNPHMGQFEPTCTLRNLRSYVVENISLPFRQFAMSTSFPRRELTREDDDKTLLELELVPTAVILILPLKNSNITTTVTSTQDISLMPRFVWSIFAVVTHVYYYVIGYFTGRRNSQDQQSSSAENKDTSNNAGGSIQSNIQNVATSSGLVRRYMSNREGTTIKTEGNIHRLHSGGDDNDENNTWNGNSTQQM